MSIPLNIGVLPNNFCPATYQDILNGFGAQLSVTIPSGTGGISISTTKPSNTANIWFQVDALGRYIRTYLYGQGAWLSAHPNQPGLTQWWFAALPNFATFDGGDGGALGPQSGSMWQQATDSNGTLIAAQFVLTPGTLPSGAVVAIGNTGGEENHTLLSAEMPSHTHTVVPAWLFTAGGFSIVAGGGLNTAGAASVTGATGGSAAAGNPTTPHNNLPCYVTGFLLQRTSRIFYAVN
jgi:hypothetical protein